MNRLAFVCYGLIAALFLLSIPLHCVGAAARVTCGSLIFGGIFGASLAMVTRTPRPLLIYLWLLIALSSIAPLYLGWPSGSEYDIVAWKNAPGIVFNYFDFLRGGGFLLSLFYPFARLGQHASDVSRV